MKPQYIQRGGHHRGGRDRRMVRFSEPPRRGRVYKERYQPYRPPTPSQSGRGRPLQRECPPARAREPRVCRFCKSSVLNLSAHNRKMHSMKFVGWECPRCQYFEAQADKSRFRRHLSLHHPAPGLEECLVQVHEGYMRPVLCPSCDFQARNSLYLSPHLSKVHFVAPGGPSQVKPEASTQEEEVVDRRIAELQETLQQRLEVLGIGNTSGQVTPKKDEASLPSAPPPTPRRKSVDERLAEMEAWVKEIQNRPEGPVPPPTPPAQETQDHQDPEMVDIVAEAAAACELSLEDAMDTSSPAPPPPPPKVPMPAELLPGFAEQLKPLPPHPNLISGSPAKRKVKTFKLVERPDAAPPGAIHFVINDKGRMEDQAGEAVSSLSINK